MNCNVKCPHCGNIVEFKENVIGHEVECPKCLQLFVGEPIFHASSATRKKAEELRQYETPKKESSCFSGFVMGLVLTIAGVFIAQMIYGRDGAKAAWRGVLAQLVIGFGFWLLAELFLK